MTEGLTISSKNSASLPASQDFQGLRAEGIKLLEVLTPFRWTDFNAHDPGITILEAICFALTEAGLLANSDVRDFVARESGSSLPFLPGLNEMLGIAPCTSRDYEKFISDVPDIHRGWRIDNPIPPLTFFAIPVVINNTNHYNLSYQFNNGNVVALQGLHEIYFEPQQPQLIGNLIRSKQIVLDGHKYIVEIAAPYWDSFPNSWYAPITIDPNGITVTDNSPVTTEEFLFAVSFSVFYNTGIPHQFATVIRLAPLDYSGPINRPAVWANLATLLSDETDPDNLVKTLANKIQQLSAIRESLINVTQYNRNICTEVTKIEPGRIQEIAISAELEIGTTANIEKMLAQIFSNIDAFISPRLKYQPHTNIKRNTSDAADLLDGPILNKGILDDEHLEYKFKNTLYTSDFINIILTDPTGEDQANDVLAVTDISLSNYLNNHIITERALNCMSIPNAGVYRPVFSAVKSKITLLQRGNELVYDKNRVLEYFYQIQLKNYLTNSNSSLDDLQLSSAGTAPLSDYYHSIQWDFPNNYGIVEGQLSPSSPALRLAQAKQLNVYLLLIDQILANSVMNIANMSRLYDLEPELTSTRFTKPLYEAPGIQEVLIDFLNSNSSWNNFITDTDNDYIKTLKAITEDDSRFLGRRLAFLQHLLARFGENIEEYINTTIAFRSASIADINMLPSVIDSTRKILISDCLSLLERIPSLTERRNLGFSIGKVLDFVPDGLNWRWHVLDIDGTPLLKSATVLSTKLAAFDHFVNALEILQNPTFLEISTGPPFEITVFDGQIFASANPLAEGVQNYPSTASATKSVEQIYKQLEMIWNSDNRAGFSRKLSYLLGFNAPKRRNFVNIDPLRYFVIQTDGVNFGFLLQHGDLKAVIQSGFVFGSAALTLVAIKEIIVAAVDGTNYSLMLNNAVLDVTITAPLPGTAIAISTVPFDGKSTIAQEKERIIAFFINHFGPQEGMYVIEHLLLRPRIKGPTLSDSLLSIPGAPIQIEKDPYSFQLSIVIPDGNVSGALLGVSGIPSRFLDNAFRALVEKTINSECPAYILPRILRLDNTKMNAFQHIYKRWLVHRMTINANDETFVVVQQDLVTALTT